LQRAVLDRADDGSLIRKAGVMGVVLRDGEVHAGDEIAVRLPVGPALPLEPV
jgi:MOSC domain-containing protein YiiM